MLFFIGSLFLHIYNHWLKPSNKIEADEISINEMPFIKLIQKGYRQSCSVILRKTGHIDRGSSSNVWRHGSVSACMERLMMETHGKQLIFTDPKITVPLRDWTSYINQQKYPVMYKTESEGKMFILITAEQGLEIDNLEKLQQQEDVVKLSDCITPLAWKSGKLFGIIGECSEENLTQLALAFVNKSLEIEDNLQPVELCTVQLEGHAQTLLKTDSSASFPIVQSATDLNLLHKPLADDPTLTTVIENGASASYLPYSNLMTQNSSSSAENSDGEDHIIQVLGNHTNEAYLVKFEDGAGESLFSGMGPEGSEIELSSLTKAFMFGSCSNTSSQQGSPLKGHFNEEGGGEALSPTVEYEGLLAPFRGYNGNLKSKPPNVLIYCGKKDSQRHFETLKNVFSLCLNSDRYIVYHLKHEHIFTSPWLANTSCLIISCDRLYDHIENKFLEYFRQGGYVLSFSSTFDSLFVEKEKQGSFSGVLNLKYPPNAAATVTTICGRTSYSKESVCKLKDVELRAVGVDTDNRNVIMEAVHESSGGLAVLSQSNLDKDPSDMAISPEIFSILKQANPGRFKILRAILRSLGLDSEPGSPPQVTACHLFAEHQKSIDILMNSLEKRLKDGFLPSSKINLHFVKSSEQSTAKLQSDTVSVVMDASLSTVKFNTPDYIQNLQSKYLGKTVIHGDVVTSTMPFLDSLMISTPKDSGLIIIANRQTGGKGRGGNAWIGPEGCAMFSLHVKLSMSSALGQKLSFIQHITTLAVVEAVTSLEGYQNFPLRIKWPNDIYYEKSIKVGGAIVNSSIMGDAVDVNIGCGVNVRNNNPTACINELIQQFNKTHNIELLPLSPEQLIGRTVTQIEQLVELFQSGGEKDLLEKYYSRWIHGSQRVSIVPDNTEATVVGLDEYGFLKVQKDDGNLLSLHPDGNSFDMMKNLICPKS